MDGGLFRVCVVTLASVSRHRDILRVGVTLAGHQKKILNSVQMMRAQMNQIQSVEVWPFRAEWRRRWGGGGRRRSGCRVLGAEGGVDVFLFFFYFAWQCVWSSHQTTIIPRSPLHPPPSSSYPLTLTLPPSLEVELHVRGVRRPTHLWSQKHGRLEVTSYTTLLFFFQSSTNFHLMLNILLFWFCFCFFLLIL